MTLATVYYAGSLKEFLEMEDDTVVNVTDTAPEKFEVLVKCHPRSSDLTATVDGSYTATWGTLNRYPLERRIN